MTHAGRPKLRIRRLESIARRADCCVRPLTRPALAGLQWVGFRVIPARPPNPVRARPCSLFMARDGARPAQAPPGPVSLLATLSQPKRCRLCSILCLQAVCHAECSRRLRATAASPVVHSGCATGDLGLRVELKIKHSKLAKSLPKAADCLIGPWAGHRT
jgi:hypothetical protein